MVVNNGDDIKGLISLKLKYGDKTARKSFRVAYLPDLRRQARESVAQQTAGAQGVITSSRGQMYIPKPVGGAVHTNMS